MVKESHNKKEVKNKVTSKKGKKTEEKDIVKKENKKKVSPKKIEKKAKKGGIIGWFKDVKKEVSKVKWPSKKEMIKYSIATIVFIIFFALFFYAIELLMAFFKSLV